MSGSAILGGWQRGGNAAAGVAFLDFNHMYTIFVYAELHCLTNFSFLEAASHPDELVGRAAELGYAALAVTDVNSLAGVVRAHTAAKDHPLHLIVGSEIRPVDAPPVVLWAKDRRGYA